MIKKPILYLLLFSLFLAVGCSDKVQVSGKVSFPDGSPLDVGIVVFETEKFSATGRIQKDGTYVLGSFKDNDGVPPGNYKVCVTGASKQSGEVNFKSTAPSGGLERTETVQSLPMFVSVIDEKYTRPETTDITCNVSKAMTFDFTVEPPNK